MYFATLHNPTTTYPLGGVTGTDVNLAVIDVRYDFGVPVRLDLFQLAASVEVSAAITVSADGQSWSAVHTFTGNGLLPFTGQTAQHWNVRLTGGRPLHPPCARVTSDLVRRTSIRGSVRVRSSDGQTFRLP